jgi:hypothetical protein
VLFWFLFFMISHGIELSIGGLDCGRMSSCCYLKAGSFAQQHSGGKMRRRAKYSMFGLCVGSNIVLV